MSNIAFFKLSFNQIIKSQHNQHVEMDGLKKNRFKGVYDKETVRLFSEKHPEILDLKFIT